MAKTVEAINAIIDHITNGDHVWEPSKYLYSRRVSGVTENGIEYNLVYNYQLGTCYMTGTLGSDADEVEMFFRYNQGFQFKFTLLQGEDFTDSYPPFAVTQVKEMLAHRATV